MTKNTSELSKETVDCIRTNVSKFLKGFKKLSQYRIKKIIKAEIEDPWRFYIGNNNETREDGICRYYNTVGNERLLMNYIKNHFMKRVELHFNLKLKDYV